MLLCFRLYPTPKATLAPGREVYIPSPIQQFFNKLALACLKTFGFIARGLIKAVKPLAPAFSWVGRLLAQWVILPVYKTIVVINLKLFRWLGQARGVLFFLFTNRYLFHGTILAITALTVFSQFQAKGASAGEAGQRTLLYSLVSDGSETITEEQVRPELLAKNSNYLGDNVIEAIPDVDFDYDASLDDLAGESIPGNIAVSPSETPSEVPDRVVTRTQTENYAVASGDTIASIAANYNVTVGTIIWANDLNKNSVIRPGDKLKIPPLSGVLHTVKKGDTIQKLSDLYEAKSDDIYNANRLSPESSLMIGEELVIPGGTPPAPVVPIAVAPKPGAKPPVTTAKPVIRPGVPKTTIANKSVDIYQESSNDENDGRTKPADVVEAKPTTKLLWPTRQHVITQYYGWKHTGVDLDGDYTDPIYASGDGVVETAGWNNGGYGLQIVIDHQNGYKTRYAHSSKMFVKVGDHVKRGEVIAMVGTTGRSTGTHLHYEVYVNGKRVNPLAYVR